MVFNRSAVGAFCSATDTAVEFGFATQTHMDTAVGY